MIELVVKLKNHHDEERKTGKIISTKDPTGRTAKALGLGVVTVKRIMSRYEKSGGKVIVHIKQPSGRPPSGICPSIQPIVRQFIRAENLLGQRVSIERVSKFLQSEHSVDVPKMTLWRALNRWGFTHGEGRRRNSLKEHNRVILARRDYLRAKWQIAIQMGHLNALKFTWMKPTLTKIILVDSHGILMKTDL